MNKRVKNVITAVVFFAIVAAFFYLLINGIKTDYTKALTLEEIAQADLSKVAVPIGPSISDWYPEQLITPEEFKEKEFTPGAKEDKAMYGTYRMVLPLPAGKVYGIAGLTCSYAQKVYVNGVLMSEEGSVADNPEDFVPHTDTYSIFFTPQTDTTEIVVQMAHFNNKNGYFNQVYLAEQGLIVHINRDNFLASGLKVGTLIAFAIFFFGMYLFYLNKRHLLWFALVCFCSGLYDFIFQNKDIMALIPDLPWALSHKMEYISQLLLYVFLILFTVAITKMKVGKWYKVVFFTIISAVVLFYVIAPSTFYSYHKPPVMNTYFLTITVASVYVVWKAISTKLYKNTVDTIVMLGFILAIGVYILDFYTDRNYNIQPFSIILMVFFNAIAIIMHFSITERALNLARLREIEISESNAMLERMSDLKNDFLHNIAHEMKTPLTVMSGYAQLTDWQLRAGEIDNETEVNLKTISSEASRLSDMVTRLLELSFNKDVMLKKSKVDPLVIFSDAAAVCRPVLQKNENHLEMNMESLPDVYVNQESILQVLVNLTINSNRHTKNGVISYKAVCDEDKVIFTVKDNGKGIAPELVPYIFDKGISGDKGTGMGLAISREIIVQNNGEIFLEETSPQGTSFVFTLPIWKEGQDNE